ncbi:hypothetical protein JW935_28635 [candidate division KSB1 bacterium]|nr:hypothetical protein [candidate division KSB1 bacterium]
MKSQTEKSFTDALTMRSLESHLRDDLKSSLSTAIEAGAVFSYRATPLAIFRGTVSEAIGTHTERLKSLLRECDAPGSEPSGAASAEDYYWAVRFAVSRAVTAIQGSLAELLALGPLVQLVGELKMARKIPKATQIWVGDSIMTPNSRGTVVAKAADVHLLVLSSARQSATVFGVAEVKSYRCSQKKITKQLGNHLSLASRTLAMQSFDGKHVLHTARLAHKPLKISVIPSSWRLSRHYQFKTRGDGRVLIVSPPRPVSTAIAIANAPDQWKVVLRWSHEALANAAFEIFLWCLGRFGEEVYSHQPSPWPDMSPAEAGQNSVKMALYYAILHISEPTTLAQAIKLYNVLGFGFALGYNFRGSDGRPAMLWPEDLDEILTHGRTREGSFIDGIPPNKPDAGDA